MNGHPRLSRRLRAALASVCLGGCAAHPHPVLYVRAEPVADPPSTALIAAPAAPPAVQPGQLKTLPRAVAPTGGKAVAPSPQQVVADANRQASQVPDRAGTFNAIVQYAFEPGSLYQVYAAPMRVTDLVLQPGEKIVGQPASGDVVRWVLAVGKSVQAGVEQWHIYVKPTRPELETNLAINTDRRSYLLELHSYPDTYMAAVTWHYPQDDFLRLQAEANESAAREQSSAPVVSLEALHFNYAIEVVEGKPSWTPLQVFDDGRRTFIRFPETMLVREAPALFVLRNKETQLVNYRVKNTFYVADRLLDAAELRVGQKNQEIVRITRTAGR